MKLDEIQNLDKHLLQSNTSKYPMRHNKIFIEQNLWLFLIHICYTEIANNSLKVIKLGFFLFGVTVLKVKRSVQGKRA